MAFEIIEMSIDQYEPIYELWENSEGVGLSASDEKGEIEKFLRRNPGLCFTAWRENTLVGAILCGHDGRRALITHLAVSESNRRMGIGKALVDRCFEALRQQGLGTADTAK